MDITVGAATITADISNKARLCLRTVCEFTKGINIGASMHI